MQPQLVAACRIEPNAEDGAAVAAPVRREVRYLEIADLRGRARSRDSLDEQLQRRLRARTSKEDALAIGRPLRRECRSVERHPALDARDEVTNPDIQVAAAAGPRKGDAAGVWRKAEPGVHCRGLDRGSGAAAAVGPAEGRPGFPRGKPGGQAG